MVPWKLPPREKIYEAFSVLSDKRYVLNDGNATITSSAGDKKYTVKWTPNNESIVITSNDNASKWQGYTGYPIIAILMITGRLRFKDSVLPYFKNIAWNELNRKFRNNYAAVVDMILSDIKNTVIEKEIREQVNEIFDQLEKLKLLKPESGKK